MKKIIISLLVLGILIFTGLLIYEANQIGQKDHGQIIYKKVPTCHLQSEFCLLKVPEIGMAKFSIKPRPIRMNQTLELKLTADFTRDIEVWVDFLGKEMDMGYNRVKLNQNDNIYTAQGFLPTCSRDKMTWQSTLLIKVNNKITYGYVFKFITRKNEK